MSSSSRILRLCGSLALLPATVSAQTRPQFSQPEAELTGGRVASLVAGHIQAGTLPDILYLNSLSVSGTTLTVTAGQLLNRQGFTNLDQNKITFSGVLGAVAAIADLDNDGHADLAFALSPTTLTEPDLCVYYGTGSDITGGPTIYPIGQRSGCMTLPNNSTRVPTFSYLAAAPFNNGGVPQLFAVDSANLLIDVVGNTLSPSNGGTLTGFHLASQIAIPAADGPGPILLADVNNDGHTDILINNQTSLSVTIYLGNGDGTFQAPLRIQTGQARSMLLSDLDGDGIPDLVLEIADGRIEFFHGNNSGPNPFAATATGGSDPNAPAITGSGGQLVGAGDLNHDGIPDIVTATPAGLSVLLGQPPTVSNGQRSAIFTLSAIYNIGPGRASFALADFDGDGNLDLAVDSPEGVAIIPGLGEGTFQTSRAFATGLPALSSAVADFNANRKPDLAVATGTTQAAILLGNGDGTFQPYQQSNGTPAFNPALWANLLAADLNGDGVPDLLFAATGLPLPTSGSGLEVQFGNGDGTFAPPRPLSAFGLAVPSGNTLFGEAALGDFNGDGLLDIASIDATFYDTIFSSKGNGFSLGMNLAEDANSQDSDDLDSFSQVAAGYLAAHRTSGPQDLVFEDDANIYPFLNSGDGVNFTRMPALPNPPGQGLYYNGTILVADMDGDGNGDIIVPYHNLTSNPANPDPSQPDLLYIWYGNGNGTFSQPVSTQLSRNFYLAQIADLNNDGRPDLVLSDGFLVGILYNQGNRTFGSEADLLAGQGINSISVADVNGDGSPDLIVGNGGLTISAPVAIGGLTQTSIALTPNPAPNTGGITVLLNAVTTRPVTGTLTASPNPAKYQATLGEGVNCAVRVIGCAAEAAGALVRQTGAGERDGRGEAGESSASVTQVVTALPPPGSTNFSITVTPNPVSVGVGGSAALTVTVKAIPAGGGSTVLLVSAMAPHTCGTDTPYFVATTTVPGPYTPLGIPAAAALFSLALPGRRRRWLRLLLAFFAVSAVLQMTACGTCTDLGTRPATYTIQVSASASANSETEATPVTLNVHL